MHLVASARGRPASRLDVSCPKVAALLNPKKANEKGLAAKLNKENKKHGPADLMGAPAVKAKVVSIIGQSFSAFKDLAVDTKKDWWAVSVTSLQVLATAPGAWSCGALPWCTAKAVLNVSGREVVAGCPWASVQGQTFQGEAGLGLE